MNEHPSFEQLQAFLAGTASELESWQVLAHLLRGCDVCEAAIRLDAGGLLNAVLEDLEVEPEEAEMTPLESRLYDEAIDRALENVRLHGGNAPKRSKQLRKLLSRIEKDGIEVADPKVYDRYVVYEASLIRAQQLRHEDPQELVKMALNAVLAATWFSPEHGFSKEQIADFRARATAELANAMRVADRLAEADLHIERAFHWAAVGTHDLALSLHLRRVKASIRGAQHRYSETIALLDEVVHAHKATENFHAAGEALIAKGLYVGYSGDSLGAVEILKEAARLLVPGREPSLERAVVHNQVLMLTNAGLFDDAWSLLKRSDAILATGGRLDLAKLLGALGRIYAGLDLLELAEAASASAKEGYRVLGLHAHAAYTALDLATIVMKRGRPEEARAYAVEALNVFTQLKIRDEQVEALLVLGEAIKSDLLSAGLLQSVADFLRRAEHDPKARFEPQFG